MYMHILVHYHIFLNVSSDLICLVMCQAFTEALARVPKQFCSCGPVLEDESQLHTLNNRLKYIGEHS